MPQRKSEQRWEWVHFQVQQFENASLRRKLLCKGPEVETHLPYMKSCVWVDGATRLWFAGNPILPYNDKTEDRDRKTWSSKIQRHEASIIEELMAWHTPENSSFYKASLHKCTLNVIAEQVQESSWEKNSVWAYCRFSINCLIWCSQTPPEVDNVGFTIFADEEIKARALSKLPQFIQLFSSSPSSSHWATLHIRTTWLSPIICSPVSDLSNTIGSSYLIHLFIQRALIKHLPSSWPLNRQWEYKEQGAASLHTGVCGQRQVWN